MCVKRERQGLHGHLGDLHCIKKHTLTTNRCRVSASQCRILQEEGVHLRVYCKLEHSCTGGRIPCLLLMEMCNCRDYGIKIEICLSGGVCVCVCVCVCVRVCVCVCVCVCAVLT